MGADDLQFTDPASAVRRLRIRSHWPGANAAVIQISSEPFVTDEDLIERYCRNDNARATIKAIEVGLARRGWTEVSIDFHELLLGSRAGDSPTDVTTLEEMMAGAPLYVRAVPVKRIVDLEQRLCDAEEHGAPGTVVFAKLPTVPTTSVQPWDANIRRLDYWGPVFHDGPSLNERCYRVVQEHTIDTTSKQTLWDVDVADAAGLSHGDTVGPPLRFCVKVASSSSGWFEDFADSFSNLVTGVVDFIGALVNDVAAVYENIKAKVAAVIVDVLAAVGVPCGEEPPHAPRFNRLTAKPGRCVTFEFAPVGLTANVPYFFPYAKQGTFKTEIFAHTWTGYLQPEFTAIRADCVGAPD